MQARAQSGGMNARHGRLHAGQAAGPVVGVDGIVSPAGIPVFAEMHHVKAAPQGQRDRIVHLRLRDVDVHVGAATLLGRKRPRAAGVRMRHARRHRHRLEGADERGARPRREADLSSDIGRIFRTHLRRHVRTRRCNRIQIVPAQRNAGKVVRDDLRKGARVFATGYAAQAAEAQFAHIGQRDRTHLERPTTRERHHAHDDLARCLAVFPDPGVLTARLDGR